MIPLRHTLPRHKTPIVNRSLVLVNVLVFIAMLFAGGRAELVMDRLGFVPARLLNPSAYGYTPAEAAVTLVTSLFIHGGVVHLCGNMIYLWVFGGLVEEVLGHLRYLLFFVVCGAVGSLAHTCVFPQSPIPSIGASGSIAGILGAFLVLRPRARIVTLFPLVVYWAMAEIRAILFLPLWFAIQFFNGFLELAAAARTQEAIGIAWWAHIGGFLFGAAVGAGVRWGRRQSPSSESSPSS
ncbi:MAG TPA: rhomboid family intramembrane serine protease [Thermoanaerobaculia bacterium]|nr:rhomboid family intramembrane serine protease [Thermoanaerobaculia bacterium]